MKYLIVCFCILFAPVTRAQDTGYTSFDTGAELLGYPAGIITGFHIAYNFRVHHSILAGIAHNKANRKDFGEHDDERGGGWGGHIGYRYYFRYKPYGFFVGERNDVWGLTIHWKQGTATGTSTITVLQPTLELGYTFLIHDQLFITPVLANGAEFNLKTRGEKVGQGFITLLGLSAGYRF
ncbi:MAG: hypothetical protein GC171_01515 [Terrimonas sp.]|nr:hypothetical protein [Terrimonas sp.]